MSITFDYVAVIQTELNEWLQNASFQALKEVCIELKPAPSVLAKVLEGASRANSAASVVLNTQNAAIFLEQQRQLDVENNDKDRLAEENDNRLAQQSQATLTELTRAISECSNRVALKSTELSQLKAKLIIEEENKSKIDVYLTTNGRLKTVRSDVIKLEAIINQTQRDIQQLKASKDPMNRSILSKLETLRPYQTELNGYNEISQKKHTALNTETRLVNTLESELHMKRRQIAEHEGQLLANNTELDILRRHPHPASHFPIQDLNHVHMHGPTHVHPGNFNRHGVTTVHCHQDNYANQRSRIANIETQRVIHLSRLESLHCEIREITRTLSTHTGRVSQLTQDVQDFDSRTLQPSRDRVSRLETELAREQREQQQLESNISSKMQHFSNLSREQTTKNAEAAQLEFELKRVGFDAQAKETESNQFGAKITTLQQEQRRIADELGVLQNQLAQLNQSSGTHQQQLTQISQRNRGRQTCAADRAKRLAASNDDLSAKLSPELYTRYSQTLNLQQTALKAEYQLLTNNIKQLATASFFIDAIKAKLHSTSSFTGDLFYSVTQLFGFMKKRDEVNAEQERHRQTVIETFNHFDTMLSNRDALLEQHLFAELDQLWTINAPIFTKQLRQNANSIDYQQEMENLNIVKWLGVGLAILSVPLIITGVVYPSIAAALCLLGVLCFTVALILQYNLESTYESTLENLQQTLSNSVSATVENRLGFFKQQAIPMAYQKPREQAFILSHQWANEEQSMKTQQNEIQQKILTM